MIAHERGLVVGVERCDQRGSGAIGLLGDAARKRERIERSGHQQFLPGLEAKADADSDFGKLVEFVFVRALQCCWCGFAHVLIFLVVDCDGG